MKHVLLSVAACLCALISHSQTDTSTVYISKTNTETTRDSAAGYTKFYRKDNLWYGKTYDIKTNVLKSEGSYVEKNSTRPTGSFKNYNEKGGLDNIAEWDNGKPLERTWFYKNGSKKSWISYSDKGENPQKGWDETGKEIKNYVVQREARYKGGPEGWKKYLEKHLNPNVAADAGAPAGTYDVMVQFIVNKEGFVTNVKAVSIPKECKPCASEAVSVITNGPGWEAAIQNNEPVDYYAMQQVKFEVKEEAKKGKKKNKPL